MRSSPCHPKTSTLVLLLRWLLIRPLQKMGMNSTVWSEEQANASQAHLEGFLAFWPEQFGPGCREDIAGSGQQVSRCYLHRSVRHGPAAHSLVIRWLPLIWNSLGSCHARKRDLQLVAQHYNCTLGVQGYHTLQCSSFVVNLFCG